MAFSHARQSWRQRRAAQRCRTNAVSARNKCGQSYRSDEARIARRSGRLDATLSFSQRSSCERLRDWRMAPPEPLDELAAGSVWRAHKLNSFKQRVRVPCRAAPRPTADARRRRSRWASRTTRLCRTHCVACRSTPRCWRRSECSKPTERRRAVGGQTASTTTSERTRQTTRVRAAALHAPRGCGRGAFRRAAHRCLRRRPGAPVA